MSVPLHHVTQQGPVLGALVRAALTAARSRGRAGAPPETPGPELHEIVPARPRSLIEAYLRHLRVDPRRYRGEVPPHLFPQWSFPGLSRVLGEVPYDLSRVLNAGVEVTVEAPLPAGKHLHVRSQLVEVDDNERRALLSIRAITGTADVPRAIVTTTTILVPKPAPKGAPKGPKTKEQELVPLDAREVASWRLDARAGLDFALLTGDFNPIHWVPAAGRAAGFRGCILHGFATLAHAWEGLVDGVLAGDPHGVRGVSVRFVAPQRLPGAAALYLAPSGQQLWVGPAPGAPAVLSGTWTRTTPLTEDPS